MLAELTKDRDAVTAHFSAVRQKVWMPCHPCSGSQIRVLSPLPIVTMVGAHAALVCLQATLRRLASSMFKSLGVTVTLSASDHSFHHPRTKCRCCVSCARGRNLARCGHTSCSSHPSNLVKHKSWAIRLEQHTVRPCDFSQLLRLSFLLRADRDRTCSAPRSPARKRGKGSWSPHHSGFR